ncbi:MAG: major capsid protein [Wigfec virus K19_177]|nr:MAG: major capsid protein [Wigfec virus K19_177]
MSKMQSVLTNQQQFAHIAKPEIQRSTFDRSSGYKTTLNSGRLVPIYLDEALPGDTINLKATLFGRMSTPLKPVMDNIFVDLHFFSVPIRLVWDYWQKFNGEQDDPGDTTDYLVPQILAPTGGFAEGSVYDYFGVPTKIQGNLSISALPLRCYNLIYNEWYRDENLAGSVSVNKGNSSDLANEYTLLRRGKRKDYFTSALPWAQKSDPVSIPLGSTAPVTRVDNAAVWRAFSAGTNTLASPSAISVNSGNVVGAAGLSFDPGVGLVTDLSTATAVTVNALREAFQIQKMYEKDARGGTRYTEVLRAHFGVTSPDARLQRPEFLGGSTANVNIAPIAQTNSTDETSPQGNLAAMGTFSMQSNGFVKSFTEHEYVIGIASIRADINYQQGLNRLWSRETRFDFYWPSFAHLGEQAVLSKEIFCDGTSADTDVFGYQERYAEMRYRPSLVTGLYRSNATASLDIWHLAQDFATRPSLNEGFIEESPPIDRVVATPSEPQFLLDCFFKQTHARPMPTFSTPGLIDHF